MRNSKARNLTVCAAVAALYTVLSYFGNIFGLTYGPIQCRFAEALCVLPFFMPITSWGLFVGCILTNLLSAYGLVDIIFGSLATLLAALCTARMPNKWLAPLPPVVANGLIIGAMLGWIQAGGFNSAFWPAFLYNGATVALGELLACYVLGMILLYVLPGIKFFRELFTRNR